MNTYLIVKWVHVMSSVLLVGTGFGSAFYLFFTQRSGSVAAQAVVARLVVRADLWFTLPAVIVQPATGLWLAHRAGYPLDTPWIAVSLGLFALAVACWLPVLWLQARMARTAAACLQAGTALPEAYHRDRRRWEALGYPAFAAMLTVFYLMVVKPG